MSECDKYHRWEPLAEFNFNLNDSENEIDDDNIVYCLCSRAYISRNGVVGFVAKEDGSDSDMEVVRDSVSQGWEYPSHVHFSSDTSSKVKRENDEGASCYDSASHTDNCCSTEDRDTAQTHSMSQVLQLSDNGADLTSQGYHSECTNTDKFERKHQDIPPTEENYSSAGSWEKFWANNGERLIWTSWIRKHSSHINPGYQHDNIHKQRSVEQIYKEPEQKNQDNSMRERKFSYDSKVNPYKKCCAQNEHKNFDHNETKNEFWLPPRKRSCSESERVVSPSSNDSMTYVTKITLSSYQAISSSDVSSVSSASDIDDISSSSSDDQLWEETQIPIKIMDPDVYWQNLWKENYDQQFAIHYAYYSKMLKALNKKLSNIHRDAKQTVIKAQEYENNKADSQEPTVTEVQAQVEQMKLQDPISKLQTIIQIKSDLYLGSEGVLLQSGLKDDVTDGNNIDVEVKAPGDGNRDKRDREPVTAKTVESDSVISAKSVGNTNFTPYDIGGHEDTGVVKKKPETNLKRSHEIDYDEAAAEKIKATIEIMGFTVDCNLPKGEMVFRDRLSKLRPLKYGDTRLGGVQKLYYDDVGNALHLDQSDDSQDDSAIRLDEDLFSPGFKSEAHRLLDTLNHNIAEREIDNTQNENLEVTKPSSENVMDKTTIISQTSKSSEEDIHIHNQNPNESSEELTEKREDFHSYDVKNEFESNVIDKNNALEASGVPLPHDLEQSMDEAKLETGRDTVTQIAQKQFSKLDEAIPVELGDDPEIAKCWKRRHTLFHRFDDGIRLDRESWFNVTPENVARHIVQKHTYDTVLDAFCGAGGNTIQFASTSKKVIAIDIDPAKVALARHNAAVYGVADHIQFIVGDFFELAPQLKADMVFLNPPWGAPDYSINAQYDIETMLQPKPASELMSVAKTISPNISLYLPRNSKLVQILTLAKDAGGSVEVEQSYMSKEFIAITAYFY